MGLDKHAGLSQLTSAWRGGQGLPYNYGKSGCAKHMLTRKQAHLNKRTLPKGQVVACPVALTVPNTSAMVELLRVGTLCLQLRSPDPTFTQILNIWGLYVLPLVSPEFLKSARCGRTSLTRRRMRWELETGQTIVWRMRRRELRRKPGRLRRTCVGSGDGPWCGCAIPMACWLMSKSRLCGLRRSWASGVPGSA